MNIQPLIFRIALLMLSKLKEKSSVCSYVALITSVIFKGLHSEAGTIAAIVSATAGGVLFLLSDSQVRTMLGGSAPASSTLLAITIPQDAIAPRQSAAPAASTGVPVMNLALILGVISSLPQLFGLVNSTVHEVENVFGTLPGATKYAAATAKVNSILQAGVTDANTLQAASQVVGPMVNASVAMFNAVGIFGKSATATAAAPAQAAEG